METFGKRYHPPGTPPGTLSRHGDGGATRICLLEYSSEQCTETLSPTPEQCRTALQNDLADWLDVTGVNDPAAIRELGETFGLHPLALEDVLNSGQRPKIDFHEKHAFLILNLPHLIDGEIVMEQVSLFVGDGHLLSFCSGDGKAFEPVRQRLRQGFTRVLAPDSGVISSRSATVGAVVPAGTELFRLVRQGRLEWRAEVVGQDLARIRSGQRVQVTSNAGTVVEGTVRSVAPTLDPAKRVALVYVDLPGGTDNGGLKAGMYASGQFILGEVDGWLVPQTAVVSRDGFNYVFAVASQGKVLQRKVTLGARQGELVQVLEGVDGELPLVQSGAGFLNDGDLVRVTQAAPVTAASAAAPGARQR